MARVYGVRYPPMFDPCGTRHLDGDDLIERLAKSLGVNAEALKRALKDIANRNLGLDK
jgi:hypothetical protein